MGELAKAAQLEQALLPLTAGLDDIPALPVTPDQAGCSDRGGNWPGSPQSQGFI
jgi:tRNA pseudouridine55 synthase